MSKTQTFIDLLLGRTTRKLVLAVAVLAVTALAALATSAHAEVGDLRNTLTPREIELEFDTIVAIEAYDKDCKKLDRRILLAAETWILRLSDPKDGNMTQYHAAELRLKADRRGRSKESFCTTIEVLYGPVLTIEGLLRDSEK
jgi:hypothetical protein